MISVDKAVFDDLLSFKLQHLAVEIQVILERWNYPSADAFLADARSGKLREAEMDVIELRELLHDQSTLQKLKGW